MRECIQDKSKCFDIHTRFRKSSRRISACSKIIFGVDSFIGECLGTGTMLPSLFSKIIRVDQKIRRGCFWVCMRDVIDHSGRGARPLNFRSQAISMTKMVSGSSEEILFRLTAQFMTSTNIAVPIPIPMYIAIFDSLSKRLSNGMQGARK